MSTATACPASGCGVGVFASTAVIMHVLTTSSPWDCLLCREAGSSEGERKRHKKDKKKKKDKDKKVGEWAVATPGRG